MLSAVDGVRCGLLIVPYDVDTILLSLGVWGAFYFMRTGVPGLDTNHSYIVCASHHNTMMHMGQGCCYCD